jgi:hypothetical protein
MTSSGVSPASPPTSDERERDRLLSVGTVVPPAPSAPGPRWTAGRITALVAGTILVLTSIGLLGAGATGWWALTQRDAAGYITTGEHAFSSEGSALVTIPAELDSPGVGWFYSAVALGDVRIRVTPPNDGPPVFVGIGPSDDVARYVAGVSHTVISDFWSEATRDVPGDAPAAPPAGESFWAASATGSGRQTITWKAANGSWSVVVMNADGGPGLAVRADLAATLPALPLIAVGSRVLGLLVLLLGGLLIIGAIRRVRAAAASTDRGTR